MLGAAYGLHWLDPVAVLAVVSLHLTLTTQRQFKLRLITVAILLGLIFEHALLHAG